MKTLKSYIDLTLDRDGSTPPPTGQEFDALVARVEKLEEQLARVFGTLGSLKESLKKETRQ